MSEWVEWKGKSEQPEDDGTILEVKLRCPQYPDEEYIGPVEEWDWRIDGSDGDIIAYRIIKEFEA